MIGAEPKANPTAVPRKGPLQGVANKVVIVPLINAPRAPSREAISCALRVPANPGIGISQTPKKLKAITKTIEINAILKPS